MEKILKIWIMQKDSGLCIFEQSFSEDAMNIDSDLIGGFLSALQGFSYEVVNSSIEYVKLRDYLLYYDFSKEYTFVYLADPDTSTKEMKRTSESIVEAFEKRFGTGPDSVFTGDVSKYAEFGSDMETLLDSKSYYLKYMKEINDQIKQLYTDKVSTFKKYLQYPFSENSPINKEYQEISKKVYAKITNTTSKIGDKIKNAAIKFVKDAKREAGNNETEETENKDTQSEKPETEPESQNESESNDT